MRLAFAVAAHLEPEILVIDEVLAVGDADFQKKCLNKMQDVGQQGRTVLFVSHNMSAITRLCRRTILLGEGRVLDDGPSHRVVGTYLNSRLGMTAVREWHDPQRAPGGEIARLRTVRVRTEDGETMDTVDIRRPVGLEMEYEILKPNYVFIPNFNLYDQSSIRVFTTHDQDPTWRRRPRPVGHYVSTAWIPGNLLSEGTLYVEPAMMTPEPFIAHFRERNAIAFQVVDSMDGDSARGDWGGPMEGIVRPLLKWNTLFNPVGPCVVQGTEGRAIDKA